MKKPTGDESLEELRSRFAQYNQSHVFDWYDQLSAEEQEELLNQLRTFDADQITTIFQNSMATKEHELGELTPVRDFQKVEDTTEEMRRKWEKVGFQALYDGKIALVVLAGGSGSRLGFEGPKGM